MLITCGFSVLDRSHKIEAHVNLTHLIGPRRATAMRAALAFLLVSRACNSLHGHTVQGVHIIIDGDVWLQRALRLRLSKDS